MSTLRATAIALVIALAGACRTQSASTELVSGCVNVDYSFRELLDRCSRETGVVFLLQDGVERDLARMDGTLTSCFVPEGTDGATLQMPASLDLIQQMVLRTRACTELDLMIDRYPLHGTKTYRIYRLARSEPSRWSVVSAAFVDEAVSR